MTKNVVKTVMTGKKSTMTRMNWWHHPLQLNYSCFAGVKHVQCCRGSCHRRGAVMSTLVLTAICSVATWRRRRSMARTWRPIAEEVVIVAKWFFLKSKWKFPCSVQWRQRVSSITHFWFWSQWQLLSMISRKLTSSGSKLKCWPRVSDEGSCLTTSPGLREILSSVSRFVSTTKEWRWWYWEAAKEVNESLEKLT